MSYRQRMPPHHDAFIGTVAEAPTERTGWLWIIKSEDGRTVRAQGDWSFGEIEVGRRVEYLRVHLEGGPTRGFMRSPPGSGESPLSNGRMRECRVLEVPQLENADSFLLESKVGERFRVPLAFVRGEPVGGDWGFLEVADPSSNSRPWRFTPDDFDGSPRLDIPEAVEGSPGAGRVWNGYRWVPLIEAIVSGLVGLEVLGIPVEEHWVGTKDGLRQVWLLEGLVVTSPSPTQLTSVGIHPTLESARQTIETRANELDETERLERAWLDTSLHQRMIRELAEAETEKIVQKTIWHLRRMKPSEFSPYQGLGFLTRWDEISWQVQKSHGPFWNMDLWAIEQTVGKLLNSLPAVYRQAMWLETEVGDSWLWNEALWLSGREAHKSMDWTDDIVVDWITEKVLMEADGENNSRIFNAHEMGYGS